MRLNKILAAAAIASTAAGSAMAGGFAPVVEVPEVVVIEEDVAVGGGFSLPVWVIPAAVLTALVAIAAASESDGESD
ncbi:hypothetical protein [Pseudoroseicyclus tamaricis]|uniref:Ferrochelatase n=1 Tax=Pseudoroseicyclus tamaricis TaxID=2705421 RepID=A0A6B2K211_9RHOB|nr:hypothetical protein [Pseudoroseicyclus tamaricis]NDV02554.1 hypothetical protein [Pseudoroseicyclus tamaricis]